MGNVCLSESEEVWEWKHEISELCKNYSLFPWSQQIQFQIRNIEAVREIQLRDIYLMNALFLNNKIENSESEHATISQKNMKKFIRRSGLSEQQLEQNDISFSGSLLSDTQSYIYHEKACQVSEVSIRSMDYFAHFTDIIKYQIKTNEISHLIRFFKQSYQTDETYLDSFKAFIDFLYQSVVSYYKILNFKQELPRYSGLINKDTLINFITNCLLQDRELYDKIFNKISEELQDKCYITKKMMIENQNQSTREMGISREFQFLDEHQPYLQPIRILQKVQQKQGPASKVKVILKMSQVITLCMSKGRGKSLLIATDDMLPVLRYVIIKSQIYDIHVHIFILQNLLTQNVLSSNLGFFITSLQASIEQ
ncbi:unnamed protein product (macronuclear) [Paramecium tetraurelia]|uniref:VPS9 domain-containing protein n=1 Tax=Paramecium tetraurelia TaxID=5888 RepID=A0CC80_PARTE|nr:uncharacterized protein GSPATT00037181001 [Paramecium tetraurelia]CAK68397.1 unnamed protein product [Paramecium tetraurelia]|eukprot:XP_001435794.1 hypothetical protein (macronuclear) [Paramecium tetraurelia strain d4-2]